MMGKNAQRRHNVKLINTILREPRWLDLGWAPPSVRMSKAYEAQRERLDPGKYIPNRAARRHAE